MLFNSWNFLIIKMSMNESVAQKALKYRFHESICLWMHKWLAFILVVVCVILPHVLDDNMELYASSDLIFVCRGIECNRKDINSFRKFNFLICNKKYGKFVILQEWVCDYVNKPPCYRLTSLIHLRVHFP